MSMINFKDFTYMIKLDGTRQKRGSNVENSYDKPEPYIASGELIKAVNIALYLRRPLLLEGEPGCGKTRLAHAIAYELNVPLHECYIRSTNQAKDLLYAYDAVNRIYDIHEKKLDETHKKYVKYGGLGNAIKDSAERNIPSVVLIDEIDKADIDFPNDLLHVIDRLQFDVDELEEKGKIKRFDALEANQGIKGKRNLPLFIITSNREKELPKPFLRRCLYYYLEFPTPDILLEIINQRFQEESKNPAIFESWRDRFLELRNLPINWRKKPGTSELLDWINLLLPDEEILDIPFDELPYLETLAKTESDLYGIKKSGRKDEV